MQNCAEKPCPCVRSDDQDHRWGKNGAGEENTKPPHTPAMALPAWLSHGSCHGPDSADDTTPHLQVSTGLPRATASSLVGQTAMPMSGVRKMVSGSQPW